MVGARLGGARVTESRLGGLDCGADDDTGLSRPGAGTRCVSEGITRERINN